jgi:hypothetical protein
MFCHALQPCSMSLNISRDAPLLCMTPRAFFGKGMQACVSVLKKFLPAPHACMPFPDLSADASLPLQYCAV